jgi:hypothetical protein
MNEGAGVHALDALKEWHAALALFREDAGNAVCSMTTALQKAGDWLIEQQQLWRREQRRAEEEVSRARHDLQNRQYQDWSGHEPDTTVQEKALRKAQARLGYVEERLEAIRRWMLRLPVAIQDIFDGPARTLTLFVDNGLPRALAQLTRQLDALDQYVGLAAPPQTGGQP